MRDLVAPLPPRPVPGTSPGIATGEGSNPKRTTGEIRVSGRREAAPISNQTAAVHQVLVETVVEHAVEIAAIQANVVQFTV